MRTWLVTGCSTGLGRARARARGGARARGVGPAPGAPPPAVADLVGPFPDTALALDLDVTDPRAVGAAVDAAHERFGGIDVLVNNAGHGYRAAVEEGAEDQVAALFATNVTGTVAMTRAALPGMRARRSGTIVVVSSIAACSAPAGSGYYAATKGAVEGLAEALSKEVAPLGIRVLVVEPGGFRTDFAGRSLQQSPTPIADYAGTAGLRRKEHDTAHGRQPGDPARAAAAVIAAVDHPDPPLRLVLGTDALTRARAELAARTAELETWAPVSLSTDFPDHELADLRPGGRP